MPRVAAAGFRLASQMVQPEDAAYDGGSRLGWTRSEVWNDPCGGQTVGTRMDRFPVGMTGSEAAARFLVNTSGREQTGVATLGRSRLPQPHATDSLARPVVRKWVAQSVISDILIGFNKAL